MKVYVGTMDMSVGNFFFGENMVDFNNLFEEKTCQNNIVLAFQFPSIFIEATLLSPGVLLRFSQSLGRNSFLGTKRQWENLSYWVS